MTLLVRNEEDLLEENVWFHAHQGIDSFIIMDNLSEDRTPDIIRALARELDVEHLTQSDDTYFQPAWLTSMARMAVTSHSADWIIHNDADEFWQSQSGTIRDFLAAAPEDVGVLKVTRHNAVLCQDKGSPLASTTDPRVSCWFESTSRNNYGYAIPPKCAHRGSLTANIHPGNHDVDGVPGATLVVEERLRILHYPYRSLDNYKRKIRLGGGAYSRNKVLPESVGATWRRHHQASDSGELERFWVETSKPYSEVMIANQEKRVFQDGSIASALREQAETRRENKIANAIADLRHTTRRQIEKFISDQTAQLTELPKDARPRNPLYYNLEYSIRGPLRHLEQITALKSGNFTDPKALDFAELRDISSLFPRNEDVMSFAATLLEAHFPTDVRRLKASCSGKRVILHVSCERLRAFAEESVKSFSGLNSSYHHIILVGRNIDASETESRLALSYDGTTLTVPVPDNYESLHRKIFYALAIIDLVSEASMVIKIDDNLHMRDAGLFEGAISTIADQQIDYAGRLIGVPIHQMQWHGWHLSKCSDPLIETRGYQYPLPRRYAAGGYGYVLNQRGIRACSYMYWAMREFFALHSVGLEDAYVGHAMYAQGIDLHDVSTAADRLAFPGLTNRDTAHAIS